MAMMALIDTRCILQV
jgi:hypothetical protein